MSWDSAATRWEFSLVRWKLSFYAGGHGLPQNLIALLGKMDILGAQQLRLPWQDDRVEVVDGYAGSFITVIAMSLRAAISSNRRVGLITPPSGTGVVVAKINFAPVTCNCPDDFAEIFLIDVTPGVENALGGNFASCRPKLKWITSHFFSPNQLLRRSKPVPVDMSVAGIRHRWPGLSADRAPARCTQLKWNRR